MANLSNTNQAKAILGGQNPSGSAVSLVGQLPNDSEKASKQDVKILQEAWLKSLETLIGMGAQMCGLVIQVQVPDKGDHAGKITGMKIGGWLK